MSFHRSCLCIHSFMKVFPTCHVACHIYDETLPAAPPKCISLLLVKFALTVCSVRRMQKFLIKPGNEQKYQQGVFIETGAEK